VNLSVNDSFNLAVQMQRQRRFAEAEGIYRQILAQVPNHSISSINLGTLLHETGQYAEAVKLYRTSLALDASPTELWSNLGNTLNDLEEYDQAAAACRQALAINPNVSSAHNNLANALKGKQDLRAAAAHYRRAMELDPNSALPHNNLGTILHVNGDLEGAAQCFQRALELSPQYPEALSNLGSTLSDLGQRNEGMEMFGKALALRPEYAEAHWNLGLALLVLGELERGWSEYEWRWRVRNLIKPRFEFPRPRWNGEDLNGRRILLHSEQGFGDAIQFSRYAPLVKQRGGRVAIYCPDDLLRLMRSLNGVEIVVGWSQPLVDFDLHCPIMSLPNVFKTTLSSIPAEIPYLHPDAQLIQKWRERIGSGSARKVGLAWAGRATHTNDRQRSFRLSQLAELAHAPNVQFFSLQKGEAAAQAKDAPMELTDWTNDLTDFADTAALIANLDLVICADTAVAHLAAAIGKPAWVLVPFAPDFRWLLDRPDTPWYPAMRLFRQKRPRDWKTPITEAAAALRDL